MTKRPSIQFYPGDWRRDSALQSCSITARGLWIEMLCIMHDCTPYGHLSVNGKAIELDQLARMAGTDLETVLRSIEELKNAGVCAESDGVLYSRRLVKDNERRAVAVKSGRRGGNPKLVKGRVKAPLKASTQKPDKGGLKHLVAVAVAVTDSSLVSSLKNLGIPVATGKSEAVNRLAEKYGAEVVLQTARDCQEQITLADRPLQYLGGILRNQSNGTQRRNSSSANPTPATPRRTAKDFGHETADEYLARTRAKAELPAVPEGTS